jgi:biopolymer transport protein ExbD
VIKRTEWPSGSDLNITPVMNLFVCLIPFLLISAVFVQLSVIETNAPSRTSRAGAADTTLVMVVITNRGFTVTGTGAAFRNSQAAAEIPKKGEEYDYATLTQMLTQFKKNDDKAQDVLLMTEPTVEYRVIIGVMDAARTAADGSPLFPNAFFGGVTS